MPPSYRTTRRTTLRGLGSLALVGSLSGCSVDDLRPPSTRATAARSASAPGQTPDEALVTAAVAAIQQSVAVVAAARTVPPLRRSLGPLLHVHRRHLATLDSEQRDSIVAASPADAATALAGLHTQEQGLAQQLTGFAVQAESGDLAALLASMVASLAQHLTALDTA